MYVAGNLHLSYSVPFVMLAAFSLFFTTPKLEVEKTYKVSWIMAVVLITVHLLALLWMLREFYGYGHEHDLKVLGHITLYLLLFIMLWPYLKHLRCRQIAGFVLAVFYTGMIFIGR